MSSQSESVLPKIELQIKEAAEELRIYPPADCDWPVRSLASARKLVPWLEDHATALAEWVEGVLNSYQDTCEKWSAVKEHGGIEKDASQRLDHHINLLAVLHQHIGGNIVSKLIEEFLIAHFTESAISSNGSSDYPDLYLNNIGYEGLPKFARLPRGSSRVYGAALKGKAERPVRVPDGLEIKTCKRSLRVDCHYPHPGLHLALIHGSDDGRVIVKDICLAFLRKEHYRQSNRATEATTVKYSFNSTPFHSIYHK